MRTVIKEKIMGIQKLILNFILPIGMGDDIRYGIESFKFKTK